MQFEFSDKLLGEISADITLVFVFQNSDDKSTKFIPLEDFHNLDKKLKNSLSETAKLTNFLGKKGEFMNFFPQDKLLSKWIVVAGLGKKSEFTPGTLRMVLGGLVGAQKGKIDSLALSIPSDELNLDPKNCSQVIAEGILLGSYEFNKYKSKKEKNRKLSAVIISKIGNADKEKVGIENAKDFSEATILARDLVNEQSAIATPAYLADLAVSIAKKDPKHLKCRIIDKEEATKMGMEAFLGIARGAETPPKFIFLEYKPEKSSKKEKLALVGKGITFDSGGINVKTGGHMVDMKMDMSGAAIILAVFSVITKLKPDYPVIGLIAATPNLISGSSIVPGDVVKAMNGKTIEVLDTDAEGRVTLADSLSFAVKEGATKIIDFATLTGAVMVALGTEISGLFSNNKRLSDDIIKAANLAGEKIWELPLEKEYKEMNKSEVADVANIPSSRYGGSITAALFLEEFVGETAWAHIDIAGPAFSSKSSQICQKGGTGYGVRTVLNLLKQ
jgi:leucyl aminopeptidase